MNAAHANAARRVAAFARVRLALIASVCGAALALGGCASEPPTRDWPMVPSQRTSVPVTVPAPEARGEPPANAAPAPPADGVPAVQAGVGGAGESAPTAGDAPVATYADIYDRIRAGYALPDVDHPAVDQQVRNYLSMPAYLDRTFERAERYLYYVTLELEARHMPLELAMLPVVESAYNPYAYSRARAAGIWQFIAPTATRYQVRVNWWQDGRRDIIDSTRAALDYLQVLHEMFDGDWLLALAAYNCGDGCVQRAVARNRAAGLPTDYFSLKIPKETRAYVPKLLAMARILGNPGDYGLAFAPIPNEPYFARVEVGRQIDLRVAAELAGVNEEELHALNPAFNRWATDPDGPHHLLVPFATAPQFTAAVATLAQDVRMPLERHLVKRGETLATLARSYKVPAATIAKLNDLHPTQPLPVGEELVLPASSIAPLRAGLVIEGETRLPRRGGRVYVVRRGDTLWSIARRNNVAMADLARWNGLAPHARLPAGHKLVLQSKARAAAKHSTSAADSPRKVQYVVRSGDTLHAISRKFQVSIAQLREWNRLDGGAIRAGQKLVVYVDGTDYGG